MSFDAEVDAKVEATGKAVAAGDHPDGWGQGPERICAEAQDETCDIAGWLRGLDRYPMSAEQQMMVDTIVADAGLLYEAIQLLTETYGES